MEEATEVELKGSQSQESQNLSKKEMWISDFNPQQQHFTFKQVEIVQVSFFVLIMFFFFSLFTFKFVLFYLILKQGFACKRLS